jgi:hypothetical protein
MADRNVPMAGAIFCRSPEMRKVSSDRFIVHVPSGMPAGAGHGAKDVLP